jgi:hypothetical protein
MSARSCTSRRCTSDRRLSPSAGRTRSRPQLVAAQHRGERSSPRLTAPSLSSPPAGLTCTLTFSVHVTPRQDGHPTQLATGVISALSRWAGARNRGTDGHEEMRKRKTDLRRVRYVPGQTDRPRSNLAALPAVVKVGGASQDLAPPTVRGSLRFTRHLASCRSTPSPSLSPVDLVMTSSLAGVSLLGSVTYSSLRKHPLAPLALSFVIFSLHSAPVDATRLRHTLKHSAVLGRLMAVERTSTSSAAFSFLTSYSHHSFSTLYTTLPSPFFGHVLVPEGPPALPDSLGVREILCCSSPPPSQASATLGRSCADTRRLARTYAALLMIVNIRYILLFSVQYEWYSFSQISFYYFLYVMCFDDQDSVMRLPV